MKLVHQLSWVVGGAIATVVLLLLVGVRVTVCRPFKVPTGAMAPTILGERRAADGKTAPGDRIFVNTLAYRTKGPSRGDIVVFSTRDIDHPGIRRDTFFVKRIVGVPGDTISISPPSLVVNGEPVLDPPIFEHMTHQTRGYRGYVLAPPAAVGRSPLFVTPADRVTLGTDEYLVFGDNSENSFDGRYFGPIRRDSIIGKVTFRYYPPSRVGAVQ